MTGTDLSLLAEEMRKAQEVLAKIMEMKSGVIGDTRIAVQASVNSTISTVSNFYGFFPIGHFQVTLNLIMKTRLSA